MRKIAKVFVEFDDGVELRYNLKEQYCNIVSSVSLSDEDNKAFNEEMSLLAKEILGALLSVC